MTPSEILHQEVCGIDEGILEVHRNIYDNEKSVASFSLIKNEKNDDGEILEPCVKTYKIPQYTHFIFGTKAYNDEGCATFKLIKQLQKLPGNIEKIYWRREPEVNSEVDFFSGRKRWVGYVRVSIYPPIKGVE